jgi:hypothetical protein
VTDGYVRYVCFHCLVLVGAKSNALLIRKSEPLMMANFRDGVFGHSPASKYILEQQPCCFVSHNPPRSPRPSAGHAY